MDKVSDNNRAHVETTETTRIESAAQLRPTTRDLVRTTELETTTYEKATRHARMHGNERGVGGVRAAFGIFLALCGIVSVYAYITPPAVINGAQDASGDLYGGVILLLVGAALITWGAISAARSEPNWQRPQTSGSTSAGSTRTHWTAADQRNSDARARSREQTGPWRRGGGNM